MRECVRPFVGVGGWESDRRRMTREEKSVFLRGIEKVFLPAPRPWHSPKGRCVHDSVVLHSILDNGCSEP